jgi:hypothetical protein
VIFAYGVRMGARNGDWQLKVGDQAAETCTFREACAAAIIANLAATNGTDDANQPISDRAANMLAHNAVILTDALIARLERDAAKAAGLTEVTQCPL